LIEKRFTILPSAAVAYDAASACFKTGKLAETSEWWKRATQLGKDSEAAWAQVAERQAKLLDNANAIKSYQTARSKSSYDGAYASELASLYSTLGRTKEAATEILILHSDERELAATYGRLSALMTSDSAAEVVLEIILGNSNTPDIALITQWYYRHTSQWDKALRITEEIDATSNPRGTEMLRFADAARSEGAYAVAIEAYGRLIGPDADKRISLSAAYGYALTLDHQLRGQKQRYHLHVPRPSAECGRHVSRCHSYRPSVE
jgi:tetratricopeptide (TPR) repeat protein